MRLMFQLLRSAVSLSMRFCTVHPAVGNQAPQSRMALRKSISYRNGRNQYVRTLHSSVATQIVSGSGLQDRLGGSVSGTVRDRDSRAWRLLGGSFSSSIPASIVVSA